MIKSVKDTNELANWESAAEEPSGGSRWVDDGILPFFYKGSIYSKAPAILRRYMPPQQGSVSPKKYLIKRVLSNDKKTIQLEVSNFAEWLTVGEVTMKHLKFGLEAVDARDSSEGKKLVATNIETGGFCVFGDYQLVDWEIRAVIGGMETTFWSEQTWKGPKLDGSVGVFRAGYKWPKRD